MFNPLLTLWPICFWFYKVTSRHIRPNSLETDFNIWRNDRAAAVLSEGLNSPSKCHHHLKAEVFDFYLTSAGIIPYSRRTVVPIHHKVLPQKLFQLTRTVCHRKKKKKEHNKLHRTKLFPQRALIPTIYLGYCLGYNEVIYLNRMDPTWFAAIQSAAHYNNATIRWQLVHNNVLHLH